MQQVASVGTVQIEVQRRLQQLEHGSLAGRPAVRARGRASRLTEIAVSEAPEAATTWLATDTSPELRLLPAPTDLLYALTNPTYTQCSQCDIGPCP